MPVQAAFGAGAYVPASHSRYDELHEDFYHRVLDGLGTQWLGVPLSKNPLDLWIFQELISELSPDLIIEVGTGMGGSALFMASICELLGKGQVLSVDRMNLDWPKHERLTYLQGESTDWQTLRKVRWAAEEKAVVMVDLDSDHARDNVKAEMEAYGQFVTPGSTMIVEDSNMNGHPMSPTYGPGPWEAIVDYLFEHPEEWAQDKECERFGFTFNPGGYLRKLK